MVLLGKLVKILVLLAALLAAGGLFFIWYVGAWNIVFPSQDHDAVAPQLPSELTAGAVLVFSKTNSFRHKEGIAGGTEIIGELAEEQDWQVYFTENGAIFNEEQLTRFDAVVFLNASGDMLSEPQEQAFKKWLTGGGGWVGIHAAGDGSHAEWKWYRDELIGAEFTAHIMGPQYQVAAVSLENPAHPVNAGVASTFEHEEEWYSWAESPRPRGFNVLATIDEDSYSPFAKIWGTETDLRMGDHPVAWSRCIGDGRSVYMAMGHKADAYRHPENRKLLSNSISWALNGQGAGCGP